MTIKTWDQAETALADKWGSFQPRPQQRQLAHGVTQTVHGNSKYGVLLAQAGCGVGKSLGYLIPALASGHRTVVSVSTKALQDQLFCKDLPTLKETLFPDLTYAMLKGRSNYLCRRAADKVGSTYSMRPGATGERADLVIPPTDEQWREMTVDSEGCVGRKACPFGDVCYSELAKQKALDARVLVVNTSLLTQDLRLRALTRGQASLLGDYRVLVVDEAHEMADIVTSGLSTQLTLRRVTDTTGKLAYHLDGTGVPSMVERVNDRAARYFNSLENWFAGQRENVRTAELSDDDYKTVADIVDLLGPLASKVSRAECSCEPVFDEETGEEDLRCEYARRTATLMSDLALFTEALSSDNVQWMERGRRGKVELKASPAEVAGWLRAVLWAPRDGEPPKTVLTSATLGIGGDFSYIGRRLGIPGYDDLDVGSPFDFERQVRLYLPPVSAPSPKKRDEWLAWSRDQMRDLVSAAGGGALLLFTSTSAMREAHAELGQWCAQRGWRPLLQGDGVDNRTLAQQFDRDRNSVLYATRSFMTGVDFAGDTCRLVVVDKMPFPVPEDPVFKARCKAVEDRFGERASFSRVSIPEMSLVLVQAFGRLIRTVDDTGVVAILDSRMRAGWAHPIRASLPAPRSVTVDSIGRVKEFYDSIGVNA